MGGDEPEPAFQVSLQAIFTAPCQVELATDRMSAGPPETQQCGRLENRPGLGMFVLSHLYLSSHGISVHFWLLQGIKNKVELSIPSFKINIYSKEESFACRKSHALLLLLTSELFAEGR